jgi:predicted nucleic acid-binding protein
MKGDKVFLDTNLLLYAYDAGSPAKHAVAVRILEDLWKSGNGILSNQILQEFFVNVTKKIPKPISVADGREIVEDFLKWKIVPVEGRTILRAIDLHEKHKYAFWDSLVIQSVGLALLCPIIDRIKGYPFEVPIPARMKVSGAVLSDQVKSMDWRALDATLICRLPEATVSEVLRKAATLLSK